MARCWQKVAHRTRADARYVINYMRRTGRRDAFRLREYRCDECGFYHLTKKDRIPTEETAPVLVSTPEKRRQQRR